MIIRKIVNINEDLCNGCGSCIPKCAEGALQIVNGKAKIIKETYCDGLGACLGECPQGAITITEREAEPFDEKEVHEHLRTTRKPSEAITPQQTSALQKPQWPVKLNLRANRGAVLRRRKSANSGRLCSSCPQKLP